MLWADMGTSPVIHLYMQCSKTVRTWDSFLSSTLPISLPLVVISFFALLVTLDCVVNNATVYSESLFLVLWCKCFRIALAFLSSFRDVCMCQCSELFYCLLCKEIATNMWHWETIFKTSYTSDTLHNILLRDEFCLYYTTILYSKIMICIFTLFKSKFIIIHCKLVERKY